MTKCKHYLPWVITYGAYGSQERNDACVNEEQQLIRPCPLAMQSNPKTCPDYEPYEQKD